MIYIQKGDEPDFLLDFKKAILKKHMIVMSSQNSEFH